MNKEQITDIKQCLISLENEKEKIKKGAKTQKRSKTIGIVFIIIGFILLILGVVIMFAKNNSKVIYMSLPVIFFGIVFYYNSKKSSYTTELVDIESQIQKLKHQLSQIN